MMKADLYTIKDIIRENRSGEFLAIYDNGKEYKASYNAKYRTMFFTIPSDVGVIGYLKIIGRN